TIDGLEGKTRERRMEGEELTQSLSMARRHGQQLETKLADLRARLSFQDQESKTTQRRVSEFETSAEESRKKIRQLEENAVDLRQKLARFEDKIRLQMQLEKDLSAQFAEETKKGIVTVKRSRDRIVIGLESSVLFSSGSATIRANAKKHLLKISLILRRYINREVQVQGHTDNIPISERIAERWESNWELSSARATRVLRYLVEVGNVDPRRMSAAGLGEYRPIADNATKGGRKKNRRIDIVLFPPSS
ncbi:MAG: flagellar motor protein MotB, partial [bacterium]